MGNTQKTVVNRRFGGFSLSEEAKTFIRERSEFDNLSRVSLRSSEARSHPAVVEAVGTLGDAADGPHANLEIVELPANVEWVITEYDGVETVREAHRCWPGGEYESGVLVDE